MRNLKQNKTMQFGAGKPLASAEPSGGDNSDHAQRFLGLNPGVLFQDLVQIPPCWVAGHPWGQGIIGFPVPPRPSKASLTCGLSGGTGGGTELHFVTHLIFRRQLY